VGDVDGDTDLDTFVVNGSGTGETNRLWLNDGAGAFIDSGQLLDSSLSRGISLGNLDGDTDLDAFVVNYNQANSVWLNDGVGNYTDLGLPLGSSSSIGVTLGQFDGDTDLDAFVVNFNQPNKVWLNDGVGNFSDSGQNLGSSGSWGLAVADIDGDSDLDVFVANGSGTGEANKVWLNDGAGNFTESGQALGDLPSRSVALGDLDGADGIDAFVANTGANMVWLGDEPVPVELSRFTVE
jgi:hypothetical protein